MQRQNRFAAVIVGMTVWFVLGSISEVRAQKELPEVNILTAVPNFAKSSTASVKNKKQRFERQC